VTASSVPLAVAVRQHPDEDVDPRATTTLIFFDTVDPNPAEGQFRRFLHRNGPSSRASAGSTRHGTRRSPISVVGLHRRVVDRVAHLVVRQHRVDAFLERQRACPTVRSATNRSGARRYDPSDQATVWIYR
jgi:hypothetical protein